MFKKINFTNPSGKTVLFLFVITQIFYVAILFYSIPQLMEYTNEQPVFDMMPTGYSADYASELLSTLGVEGRSLYVTQQIPLDFVYPGLFAMSYLLIIRFLSLRTLPNSSLVWRLSWIAVLAATFDYLENIGIISMIAIYPDFHAWLALLTSIFSVIKSVSTTLMFILIIGLLLLWLFKLTKRHLRIEQT